MRGAHSNIPPHRENGAESVCSTASIWTSKSAHTLKRGQTDVRQTRSSISSRARQIKEHECEPFLAIDVLWKTKSQPSFGQDSKTRLYSAKTDEYARLTTASGRLASAYSYAGNERPQSVFSRYPGAIRSLTLTSLARHPLKSPDIYVRTPFKQTADLPSLQATTVMSSSPGQALTESTKLALNVAREMLHKQEHQKVTTTCRGRLRKARFKSLEPVTVVGPSIHHCQGITAETRTPLTCDRKTYQRLMAILSKAHAAKRIAQDMKSPVLLHQVSEASSQNLDIDLAENAG